jgi:DegV family protein with EDD domain
MYEENELLQVEVHETASCSEKFRYCTECLIKSDQVDVEEIKMFLCEMGDSVVVAANRNKCRIHIHTNDPAEIFDYLHEKGTIIYQKIDDMVKEKFIVNQRKSNIALVTDSIADISMDIIDEYQIHVVYLDILFQDHIYMDKLTIRPERLFDISSFSKILPTSSQPSPKQIENLFDYLSTYYESVIVMTVSKELSGTYNSFKKVAEKYARKDFEISVINTKQNSVAEGLLVKSCAEFIESGRSYMEIVKEIEHQIEGSKILVQVKSLDNMIKSGRLSSKLGYIGKKIGMKPIVTLDNDGKGAIEGVAFSKKGSNKRVISHIRHILKSYKIKTYAIGHANNIKGAEELKNSVESLIGFEPEYIEETSSIVAAAAGRGAVALAYILDKEAY